MKSPAVIHFKCLDTFALQGVARSFGSGSAGVRLTRDGLSRHVRPSKRAHVREEEEQADAAGIDELLNQELAREEKADTLIPHTSSVAFAPRVVLPPAGPRASMPSLVTIEMSLRKPTTWAVVLLTLGVSFGVGLARVASDAAAIDPAPMSAAAAPHLAVAIPVAPVATQPAIHAEAALAASPVTIAMTTIVGRRHHRHLVVDGADVPAESDAKSAPVADTKSGAAPKNNAAADAKIDDGDETSAATAASAKVTRELSDSL